MQFNKPLLKRTATRMLVALAFLASLGFASRKQATMPCIGVEINIADSIGSGFVDSEDITQLIRNKFGYPVGKEISSINISLLEKIINADPFISNAEVFSTINGKLNIDVKQRVPVLRVINYKNESFYVDNEGVFMPLSEKFTARVPVANGLIFDNERGIKARLYSQVEISDSSVHRTMTDKLFHIISFANNDEFWGSAIEQLYVNSDGDIEMIPRLGNHTVILGDDSDLETKFRKLFLLYREALTKKGWNTYSTINLKFKNQVVCTKK